MTDMPKLSPSQLATVLGDTVLVTAVKADPAPLNRLASDSGAGEVGKTPWRAVAADDHQMFADVKDFYGNKLFKAPLRIAHITTVSVNAWTKLFGENCNHRDVLRAVQAQLIPIRAMPAVRRALQLIDETLNPKDDLENQEATSERR